VPRISGVRARPSAGRPASPPALRARASVWRGPRDLIQRNSAVAGGARAGAARATLPRSVEPAPRSCRARAGASRSPPSPGESLNARRAVGVDGRMIMGQPPPGPASESTDALSCPAVDWKQSCCAVRDIGARSRDALRADSDALATPSVGRHGT
jgi:hypothetical protein